MLYFQALKQVCCKITILINLEVDDQGAGGKVDYCPVEILVGVNHEAEADHDHGPGDYRESVAKYLFACRVSYHPPVIFVGLCLCIRGYPAERAAKGKIKPLGTLLPVREEIGMNVL